MADELLDIKVEDTIVATGNRGFSAESLDWPAVKVKEENKGKSEHVGGTNNAENGMKAVKAEETDASSKDTTPSAESTSARASSGQCIDTSVLTKEEDLGICFDVPTVEVKVENRLKSEEGGTNDPENGASEVTAEKAHAFSENLTSSAESILCSSGGQFVDTTVLTREEDLGMDMEEEKGSAHSDRLIDFCTSSEDIKDSWCGYKIFPKTEIAQGADEFGEVENSSREPAVSSSVDSELITGQCDKGDSSQGGLSVRSFSRTQCTASFETRQLLSQHTVVHLREKLSEYDLFNQMTSHSDKSPFYCSEINQRSDEFVEMGSSFQGPAGPTIVHFVPTLHECDESDSPQDDPLAISFACARCTASFETRELLSHHAVVHLREKLSDSGSYNQMTAHSDKSPFCHSEINQRGNEFAKIGSSSQETAVSSIVDSEQSFGMKQPVSQHRVVYLVEKPFESGFYNQMTAYSDESSFYHSDISQKADESLEIGSHSQEMAVSSIVDSEQSFGAKQPLSQHGVIHSREKPFESGLYNQMTTYSDKRLFFHSDINGRADEFAEIGSSSRETAVSSAVDSDQSCWTKQPVSQHAVVHSKEKLSESDSYNQMTTHSDKSLFLRPEINQRADKFARIGSSSQETAFSSIVDSDQSFGAKQLLLQHGVVPLREKMSESDLYNQMTTHPEKSPAHHPEINQRADEFVEIGSSSRETGVSSMADPKQSFEAKQYRRRRGRGALFSCAQCPSNFKSRASLNHHLGFHSSERPFSCPECSLRFKNRETLEKHSLAHSGEKPYLCAHCPASFKTLLNFQSHIIYFSNGKQYLCKHCPVKLSDKKKIAQHLAVHLNDKPLSCPRCSLTFRFRSALNSHSAIHLNEKPFTCGHCLTGFTSKTDLEQHLLIHSSKEPFICTHCHARFVDKDHLNKHLTVHSSEKPFICTHCSIKFAQKDNLKTHLALHSSETLFICMRCPARFTEKSSLKEHLASHSTEKPFICNECPARFTREDSLKAHSVAHLTKKPFICTDCPYTFSQKNDLKKHYLTVHASEKHCSAKFTEKNSLKQHLAGHSIKKPFIYKLRPTRSTLKINLKKHAFIQK